MDAFCGDTGTVSDLKHLIDHCTRDGFCDELQERTVASMRSLDGFEP
jgi:hypothetical protein